MDLQDILQPFLASFIPIMVALDAPGTLPLFVALTEGVQKRERKRIVRQSILTAFLVTVGFVLVGRLVFDALGIMVEDFMIAGGVVLFIIAVNDIVRAGEKRPAALGASFGVVPLGTPLIAGPATLTASLVLVGNYGYLPVILSLTVNILIAWLIFAQADRIIKLIGINGSRAFAKIMALILAAFAVKLIRAGVFKFLEG
jgi:multiple antibiotic resistance protein